MNLNEPKLKSQTMALYGVIESACWLVSQVPVVIATAYGLALASDQL